MIDNKNGTWTVNKIDLIKMLRGTYADCRKKALISDIADGSEYLSLKDSKDIVDDYLFDCCLTMEDKVFVEKAKDICESSPQFKAYLRKKIGV